MSTAGNHRILWASDGSPAAQAALGMVAHFPWKSDTQARAITARSEWMPPVSAEAEAEAEAAMQTLNKATGSAARKLLAQRWAESTATVAERPPVDAILEEAERFGATLIALGWRGHGSFARVLAGSVSRAVAARAKCPVLVAREGASGSSVRRFLVGYDGTDNANRAIDFLCSLQPTSHDEVLVLNVVTPVSMPPSVSLLPDSIRAGLHRQLADAKRDTDRVAGEAVGEALTRLRAAGWTANGEVQHGATLSTLLAAAETFRADVLVVGARATSGLERALLGSVANGVLDRSPVPVLLTR